MPVSSLTLEKTNCKNCGAPLHGSVCDYCGTSYTDQDESEVQFNELYRKLENLRCQTACARLDASMAKAINDLQCANWCTQTPPYVTPRFMLYR